MKFIFLFIIFTSSVLAQETCRPPTQRYPVSDQDGLGTCASNTASLILQHNVPDMPAAPSYIQLSIAASAPATTEFFRASRPGDTPAPEGRGDVLFNSGNQICNVLNTAMTKGFCDTNLFPLDFIGSNDILRSQQKSLETLGRILDRNEPALEALRAKLADPAQRPETIRRLAFLLFAESKTCSLEPREYMARKLWARQRAFWQAKLPLLPPGQKQQLTNLMSRTFNANGEPTRSAIEFAYSDIFIRDYERAFDRDASYATQNRMQIPELSGNESVFGVRYGYHMNIDPPNYLSNGNATSDEMRRDWQVISKCKNPAPSRVIDKFFENPECEITSDVIPAEFTQFATSMANELTYRNFDPQSALVSIIAPACSYQARTRRLSNYTCTRIDNRTAQGTRTARETAARELCAGRVFGISVCSSFMEKDSPEYSNFCAGKNAYHAMTVVSMRTVGQKRQYLIQNSWGKSCKFSNGVVPKPAFNGIVECVIGPDQMQTGRFWIDEEFLFNNTESISTMVYTP